MFDKMVFSATINIETEAHEIAERNRLEQWQSKQRIKYESNDIARFTGIYISIREKVQVKCSLHKYYNNTVYNRLENDDMFTITEARRAIYMLFNEIGLEPERAIITNFEIGLNIPTENEPIEYIEMMQSINTGIRKKIEKELFEDAYYKKSRQKTSERHKSIKKVFKVYDKDFEKIDRKRTPQSIPDKILRIETVYRRQYINITDFFNAENIRRLTDTFLRDWENVQFARPIIAEKGTRKSETDRATKILELGRENYLQQAKEEHENGLLTENQHRTIKEFVRDWDLHKSKFKKPPTPHETEYKNKLKTLFKTAKS